MTTLIGGAFPWPGKYSSSSEAHIHALVLNNRKNDRDCSFLEYATSSNNTVGWTKSIDSRTAAEVAVDATKFTPDEASAVICTHDNECVVVDVERLGQIHHSPRAAINKPERVALQAANGVATKVVWCKLWSMSMVRAKVKEERLRLAVCLADEILKRSVVFVINAKHIVQMWWVSEQIILLGHRTSRAVEDWTRAEPTATSMATTGRGLGPRLRWNRLLGARYSILGSSTDMRQGLFTGHARSFATAMKRPSFTRVASTRADSTARVHGMHAAVSHSTTRQTNTMDNIGRAAVDTGILSPRRKLLRHRNALAGLVEVQRGRGVRWVIDRRAWVFDIGRAFILRHGCAVVKVKTVVCRQVLANAEVPLPRSRAIQKRVGENYSNRHDKHHYSSRAMPHDG